ncbi:MAG: hypothetical protein ACJ8JD_13120 [Chthoniobacterales bacterium]
MRNTLSLGGMNAMRKTVFALLLCFAVQLEARLVETPPTAGQLRDWATGSCVRAGRSAGIDYLRSLDQAVALDPAGLGTLLRFTDSGWCDGGAGEGHCAILFGLLQHWGDQPFARVLRAQKKPVRKAVFNELASFPSFKRTEFPLTYASGPH